MSKGKQIYAAYRQDINIVDGTADELAQKLGVKAKTIRKWSSPSYQKQHKGRRIIVVKLGKEEM
ncbi:hypothetical protein [Avibacterium sp. 20-129]|uniref:hypothetical protein n=1 Tax=Avibacterium sp. 20-129 TaxID=2911525 RepID=UPI0022476D27|nr:hypothetical protein [Avibacterium sp. 20-129]MCW9699745.1 hypothetical protein [Avibacterium sp. 20-129]